jgi:hypothetical protein
MTAESDVVHTLPWSDFTRFHSIIYEIENKYAIKNEIELRTLKANLLRYELYGFQDKWNWQEWLDRVFLPDNALRPDTLQLNKRETVSAVVLHCERSTRFSELCLKVTEEIETIDEATTDLETVFWTRYRNADLSYWRKQGTQGATIQVNALGYYQPANQTQRAAVLDQSKGQKVKPGTNKPKDKHNGNGNNKRKDDHKITYGKDKQQKTSNGLQLPKDPNVQLLAVEVLDAGHVQANQSEQTGPAIVLLDSGAQSWVLEHQPKAMTDLTDSTQQLVCANGSTNAITTVGTVGDLKDIIVCNEFHKNLASVPRMAKDNKMCTIFTPMGSYVLKPNTKMSWKAEDVLVYAPLKKGLYQAPLNDVLNRLGGLKSKT